MLRDFVKSAKHEWASACYIPNVQDRESAGAVARRFLEVRGDAFSGGFVVREFEPFVGPEAAHGGCTASPS